MIKNEREYRITRSQTEKFERALAEWAEQAQGDTQTHPALLKAQEDALRSQLEELRTQMAEYEALRSGKKVATEVISLEELPRVLIRARIASGLTQKDLARQLGLKEQQIQRYEATEYASASYRRVMDVVRALDVKVRRGG